MQRVYKFLSILIVCSLVVSLPACKTQKKATEASLSVQQQIDQAKKRLAETMDNENLSIESKLNVIDEIRNLNLSDATLTAALNKNEQFLKEQKVIEEEVERRRLEREAEENARKEKFAKAKTEILSFFNRISQAPDIETANQLIEEALTLFDSKHSPVLVIVKKTGSLKEYDRPSSIMRYLEHIKDCKTYENNIENITFSDESGKISELELLK